MEDDTFKSALTNPSKQSIETRYLIWRAFGHALGLPIDELFEPIDIEMAAAKRERGGKTAPLTKYERFRLAQLAQNIGTTMAGCIQWLITPASLIRWMKNYQERQAQKQTEHSQQSRPKKGRPRVSEEKVTLVLRIYHSGCHGLKRIRGECYKCKVEIATSTIRKILDDHGLPPSNNRTSTNWTTFWRNHAPEMVGIDFIQITYGVLGKVFYQFALVAIEHDTRHVQLLGITDQPDHDWLTNTIRSATMDGAPLAKRRYWVHDNDGKFQTLAGVLKARGKKSAKIAVQAPDMNAYAERFIRSIRNQCFDHIIFFSDDQLWRVTKTYINHYNTERPHQGIGNVTIGP